MPDPQANPAGILFKLVVGASAARTFSAPAHYPMPSVYSLPVSTAFPVNTGVGQ